jgi:ferredoxin-NADP reductase
VAELANKPEKKRAFETYDTTVSKIEFLTSRVKGIRFQLPAGKEIHFKAGQFVQMFIPTGDKIRRTSYSIASPPHESAFFELCVTLVREGTSSPYLHALKEGDHIQAMGPLGVFTLPDPLPRDPVFIATGSGIAPFRSMIFDLIQKNSPHTIYLIFGNRYEHEGMGQAGSRAEELQTFLHAQPAGFQLERQEGLRPRSDLGFCAESQRERFLHLRSREDDRCGHRAPPLFGCSQRANPFRTVRLTRS